MNLYSLLMAYSANADAPNLMFTVSKDDLLQLIVDTVDATRERLLPLLMKHEEDRLLSKQEVCERLGIKPTTVWKLTKEGKLNPTYVSRKPSYRLSEVNALIESRNNDCL